MPLVGCPVCGKWSSPASFPAGPGDDVPVKVVRGRGRGKGFTVVEVESGLGDRDLCLALKEKLLSLTGVFTSRGYLTRGEIEAALGKPNLVPNLESALTAARTWKNRATQLAKDKEYLDDELSSAERRLASAQRNVEKVRSDEELLKVEMSRARRGLSNAKDEIESLKRQIGELRSELISRQDSEDAMSAAEEWGEAAHESSDYTEVLRSLIEAVEPLLSKMEFVAMDDRDAAGKMAAVQRALDDAREAIGG